jgi:hypothetical protein
MCTGGDDDVISSASSFSADISSIALQWQETAQLRDTCDDREATAAFVLSSMQFLMAGPVS